MFFNKFILDSTEKNIDLNNKFIKDHIEDKFITEFRNQEFTNITLYNYFALQLVRNPGMLLNAYDLFTKHYRGIESLNDYISFKKIYNELVQLQFIDIFNKFNNGTYDFIHFTVNEMYNPNDVKIKPFLIISEGSTYLLNKLNYKQISALKDFNYNEVYLSIISPNQVIILFEPTNNSLDIEIKIRKFIPYLNVTSFNLMANTLIMKKDFIEYIGNDLLYHINQNSTFLHQNNLQLLYSKSLEYEKIIK